MMEEEEWRRWRWKAGKGGPRPCIHTVSVSRVKVSQARPGQVLAHGSHPKSGTSSFFGAT